MEVLQRELKTWQPPETAAPAYSPSPGDLTAPCISSLVECIGGGYQGGKGLGAARVHTSETRRSQRVLSDVVPCYRLVKKDCGAVSGVFATVS